MSTTRMLTIFCYDVSDDKRRRRVATVLEAVAVRVQGSVFEAWMTAEQADRAARDASRFLEDGDSLRIYATPRGSLDRCATYGPVGLTPAEGYLLV